MDDSTGCDTIDQLIEMTYGYARERVTTSAEGRLSKQNQSTSQQPLKVTDKRIFTAEGEVREEFRETVEASEQKAGPAEEQPPPDPKPAADEPPAQPHGRNVRDRGENPGTPFSVFLESLIVNAYMSMGMLRNPYAPETTVDLEAARQMIDLIIMLEEKTRGNLTEEETEFLTAHLGELKLKYLQRSKAL